MIDTVDPTTTALVAIDLQHGIVAMNTAPHTAADVVSRTRAIADAVRAKGGTVIFVRVVNSSDIAQTQSQAGQTVNSINFREDVTGNGLINSSDIGLVQSKSGTALSTSAPVSSSSQPNETTNSRHPKSQGTSR